MELVFYISPVGSDDSGSLAFWLDILSQALQLSALRGNRLGNSRALSFLVSQNSKFMETWEFKNVKFPVPSPP